jgi:hypothetical protein
VKTIVIIVGVLAANIIVLWSLAHHYEFHTGMDGQIIWRCNNLTGKVEYSLAGRNKWITIISSKPFVPPPLENKEQPTLSETDKSKTFTFEEATNFQSK